MDLATSCIVMGVSTEGSLKTGKRKASELKHGP